MDIADALRQKNFHPVAICTNHFHLRSIGKLGKRSLIKPRPGADVQLSTVCSHGAGLGSFLRAAGGDLDAIVRQAVKKFAGEFIERKIKLEYTPVNIAAITDRKWLSFVFEQIISNALKYTPSGSIKIYGKDNAVIFEDTGTGISAEDLPRIFERGYTGLNGRENRRSSGLGLYICGRICRNLGHSVSAESKVGKGTKISVKFEDITKR